MSKKRGIQGESNHGSILRQPRRYYLKGTCTRSPCECWHPPECHFYKNESGCKAGDKCLFPHYNVEEQPSKKPEKCECSQKKKRRQSDDKNAVAIVKIVPQLGCVSQDSDAVVPQRGKQSWGNPMQKVLGSIQRVRFTKSTLRQASIREKEGPSLGEIQVKIPHQRSPYAISCEDRSQEETERQERCARGKAWNLARNIYKPKENDKKLEEREFVVDSGASMHMVSKKDLDSAELEAMRISENPTTVMTANGEVQTREEATVYVEELDLFVPVVFLEETPTVLSLGKLCEDHGYTYRWTSGQKPHLTPSGKIINCNFANYVPFVVLGLSTSSSTSSSPASSTSSSQDTVISTENPATERSEIMSEESRGNPSRGSAEKKTHI